MEISTFNSIRAFEDAIYQRNMRDNLAGYTAETMMAFVAARIIFDSLGLASPEVPITGTIAVSGFQATEAASCELSDIAVVISHKREAVIGR